MKTSIKITVLACAIAFASCSKAKLVEPTISTSNLIEVTSKTIEDTIENKRSVVFIMGYDKGNNTFYTDAKECFSDLNVEIVETAYSIQEIILWLNIN